MLIYREFKKLFNDTKSELAFFEHAGVSKNDATVKSVIERFSVLLELNEYVDSFEWVSSQKVLSKVKTLIENNFNYVNVAKMLGTSENTLYVMFSRCDQKLKKKIGIPLTLIQEGKCSEALNVYHLSSNELSLYEYNLKSPFLEPIINLASKKPEVAIDWVGASNALKFIKIYSKPQMELGIERSGAVLENILYILFSGDPNFIYEREMLLGFVEGKSNLEKTIDSLVSFQSILNEKK